MADGALPIRRLGVRVTGAVQGVGFRPFVHRLARELGLSGNVRNDNKGVWIEIEGDDVDAFLDRLRADPPPLARIEAITTTPQQPIHMAGFVVEDSIAGDAVQARIPADAGICEACVGELFDPLNKRYLYPFIACCDCGPRFTMTRALPYDRPQTSMAAFPLCAICANEYADPCNRRFHAEPTACATCGPRYSEAPDALLERMRRDEIIAVKGVGGFHLMCDATNEAVVARLRVRKERSDKPFAVLAANVASVRALAEVSEAEASLLASPARPIVLLKTRSPLLRSLAPGLDTIGFMLPATGFQWLLFWESAGRPAGLDWTQRTHSALFVATSANRGGEPLVTDAASAREKLAGIADAIIDHDREIVVRADDPVMRVVRGKPLPLRRGRGQTPEPIKLARAIPPTIAFGGHLKAAVCVTRGDEAFLAQHVGDLDDPETLRFHRETAAHLLSILQVKPERAACDLHPDFASSRVAFETGLPVTRVQHHHAHAAACAADNATTGPVLALVLDGYGYGENGEAWGGELLAVDGASMRRLGGLAPLSLPGGDRAAREPWRMAASVLHHLGLGEEIEERFREFPNARALAALLRHGATETTSAGRYFDAAAGLLGVSAIQRYEAEAALKLEALATPRAALGLWSLNDLSLDLTPLLTRLVDGDPTEGASLFHTELADGFAALAARAADLHGIDGVVLSGGCFANARLAEALAGALRLRKLRPLMHSYAPPGDGGLALGQAWVAGLAEGG